MRSLSQLMNDFRAKRAAYEKLNKKLPRIIGVECVRDVKDNFKKQGYDSGQGVIPWKARSARTNKMYDSRKGVKGSVYNSASPILMQTRNLFNAVKYIASGKTVIIGVDPGLVPYAKAHNEGLGRMPKRQFIPAPNEPINDRMLRSVRQKMRFELSKAMKGMEK